MNYGLMFYITIGCLAIQPGFRFIQKRTPVLENSTPGERGSLFNGHIFNGLKKMVWHLVLLPKNHINITVNLKKPS